MNGLTEQCLAIQNLFETESCYYPQPLTTLTTLFGAENCIFKETQGFYTLQLLPSCLMYSMRVPATKLDMWRQALAGTALTMLPERRVAELMCKRLIDHDATLACEPFALQPTPSRVPSKLLKRKSTAAHVNANNKEQIRVELAHRLHCEPKEIRTENVPVMVDEHSYIKCCVSAGRRKFESYIYCETPEAAERQALLGALCQSQ